MMLSRLLPMTWTLFAAVMLSFGMALMGFGAACDSATAAHRLPISVSMP